MTKKILALDIETTGLDVERDQILQIGAVMFDPKDTETPVDELPFFETLVAHERYEGDAFALAMNADILRRLADSKQARPKHAYAIEMLCRFIHTQLAEEWLHDKPHVLGHNVAAFDVAMLRNHGMNVREVLHHRPFELGSMFALPGRPLSSKDLVEGLLGRKVAHDALQDARDAVELYRIWRDPDPTWRKVFS